MKAKPIFYLNGNNRRFEDQHTISVMTGEPMPRKWQEFFELTPEEKARWDASLKLDEEYRIAEAQGFPNGIPGGRTRGDMLHYLTQQEEAHKRSMQERNFFDRSCISDKTEIQRSNNIMPSDTLTYGQSNTQPSFAFNQKSNTESPYARENNLSQMNIGIKKEPDFDVKQAIRKLADRLRAMGESAEEQSETNLPVMNGQDNNVMPVGAKSDDLTQGNQDVQAMASANLSNQRIRDPIVEDRRSLKMKGGEITGVRERAVIRYINLPNGEIVPHVVITSKSVLGGSHDGETYNDNLTSLSGYRVEESKRQSTIPSMPTNTTGKTSNNVHNIKDKHSNDYNLDTSVNVIKNKDEKKTFWDIFCETTGQYGDAGTVPLITVFDANNPNEVKTLIQDLQQYKPYIQAATDRVYKNLPDIASEAVSLVIPKLPPNLRGTALGALIVFGICLCAKEAYDEWDETTGKEGFIILLSDKLMFYFTEEWVKNIADTFGIPKKYSRPIFLVVKNALT